MKRIICLCLTAIMVMTSFTAAFGQPLPEPTGVQPYYVGTSEVVYELSPGLGRKLNMSAGLEPKTSSSVDAVRITMKVMNFVSGGVVHNQTYIAEYNYLTNYYEAEDVCTAPTPGSYYMHVTYKAYKNGVLLETITQSSKVVSVG